MDETEDSSIARRQFLQRAAKAGISIAGFGVISYLLYDPRGPGAGDEIPELATLPDYSVPPEPGKTMSIVNGSDRVQTLGRAVAALGGIERFVKPGETIAIKPNVGFASPPLLSATSQPDLVSELVRLCYAAGAKRVVVTDNPINDPAGCFLLSGIGKAADEAGARIVYPKPSTFRPITVKAAKLIRSWPVLFEPLELADKLIGVAPIKDHHRAGASMTMKNWYGLMGGRRNTFHQDIHTIIAELAMMVKPTLVILDGSETMMTNGPTGGSVSDLKRTDTMIASCDMVAADAYGCGLLDLEVEDLPYLAKAEAAGVGTVDYESLRPVRASV